MWAAARASNSQASVGRPRWADYDEDMSDEYSATEVLGILDEIGILPHMRGGGRTIQAPEAPPEEEEEEESEDLLTAHGLSIGRAGHGRGGLPERLRECATPPAEEERRVAEPRTEPRVKAPRVCVEKETIS